MFYWSLTDLRCNTIGVFDQRLPGSNVVWPHADQRRATLQVSLEDPLIARVEPIKTALYCEYNGVPVFHGPVLNPKFKGAEGALEISAIDASEWLAHDFSAVETDLVATEMSALYWSLVSLRSYDFDATSGLYLARVVRGTQANVGRALTLARQIGDSYWKLMQDAYGVLNMPEFELQPLKPDTSYERAAATGIYCAAWAQLNVADEVTGLPGGTVAKSGGTNNVRTIAPSTTTSTGGTRGTFSDKSSGISKITYPLPRGDVFVPPGTPEFEFGFGQDNLQDMTYEPDGATLKNYERAYGQAAPDGVQPAGSASKPSSIVEFGSWFGYDTTPFSTNAAVTAYAQQQVAAYGRPLEQFTLVPAMEWMKRKEDRPYGFPPVFLQDYGVGSLISGEGQFGVIRQKVLGRVTQATITEVDSHGNTKVELAVIPRVQASDVS